MIPQCTLCDCETFDYLHSLEQVGVIFRTPSNNLLPRDLLAHCRNGTSSSLFYRYYLDDHLNWLNWFHVLIFELGLLIILIDCMLLLSPFLNVIRMSVETVFFVAQLDSGIFCT